MTKFLTVWLAAVLLALAWAVPLPDDSLYQIQSNWRDQRGQLLRWPELRGQVRVVALIYTHCRSICPAIVQQMKETEEHLGVPERKRVGFVLVSMDPEADSSEQLRQFAVDHQLSENWRLLRGSAADVRELAAALDFKYRKNADREFSHSAMITLLDADGVVIQQQLGTQNGTSARLAALSQLLR